mgnify:CR=1 FL=1
MRKYFAALCLVLASAPASLHAVPKDHVVPLSAAVSDTVPHITLNWTQQLQANITAQKMHRRLKGETTWVLQATLTTTQTSYADSTVLPGIEYEYWMERTLSSVSPSPAIGYLSAGVKVPEVHDRGKLLLVIDDTMTAPLAPEIAQLQLDLAADGWTVQQISAPRLGTAVSTKALIKAAYDADPANVKMVYVLGHVPVPYSGNAAADGHPDHGGAWPADGYYGDMDGIWTDSTVNNTAASRTQNDNIPGDGKFDPSVFPSSVELQVGRVDLDRINRAPSTSMTETTRLRRYLRRAHDFRHKQGAYAAIPRRSIIRDGFGQFSGEAFAISGWSLAYTGVGQAPGAPIDEASGGQWFLPAYAGGQSYLWGHVNGAGSYESAGAFGNTTDLGHLASRAVFTSIFGSYHGDWDSDNNLMRAALAGNATGDNLGLVCFWAGRPRHYMHHLGMGETFGYGMRLSMNLGLSGGGNYSLGSFTSQAHMGLMGDPALRLHQVAPPRGLGATSAGGLVNLSWAASAESGLQGYHVYRATSTAGPFTKLTPTPQVGTTYADNTATVGTAYTYLVRTLKLDSVPGGSYYNLSVGSPVTITASGAVTSGPRNPSELAITAQTSATNAQLSWQDNAGDETGYRVERKTNAGGAYGTVGTLAANAMSFTDAGPFTQGNVYFYRVIATGAAGDSVPSNEVSFDALAGFIEFTTTKMKVNKTAGTATIAVKRFGGAVGNVGVNYATANLSALAGTHFTSTSGTLIWADGETGSKDILVPVTNTGTPQLPRQFKVNLTTPTGGSGLAQWTSVAALIEDPTATLNAPWQQTLLGSLTDSSPSVSAEGVIGSATLGGLGVTNQATSEAGRFVYQSRTGDGVMTAYVPSGVPLQGNAYMAVMVRASTANNTFSAATAVNSNNGTYGSKLAYRATVGGITTVTPSTDNNLDTPRWIRITRIGTIFFGEASADGTTWLSLGSGSVPGMPATALWGIFHYSNDWASSTTYFGDFQLGTFQNVTIEDFTTPPGVPTGLTLSYYSGLGAAYDDPSQTTVSWTAASFAAGYRIERRGDDGSLDLIDIPSGTTTSYTDYNFASDTAYQYRIHAYNSVGDGGWSTTERLVTPPADRIFSLTTDGAGNADASVRADTPDAASGTQDSVLVATMGGVVTATSKAYFRFDLSSLPAATFKTATLKLTVLSTQGIPATFFNGNTSLLSSESSDTWAESALTWNNAPQNNTSNGANLAPTVSLAGSFIFAAPANGSVFEVGFYPPENLSDNRGPNNLVTLVIRNQSTGSSMTFASREHATAVPPTLEFTYAPLEPLRPGFLTAAPGASSSLVLTWLDAATDETGFQIERRAANGTWTLLQTVAANATTFTDGTALPGVIYEYRLRASNAAGSSSWATSASLLHTRVATINNPVWSTNSLTFNRANAAPGNGYVPTGFMYYPATQNFVTSQTLSTTIRNNSGSRLGMKFTTGANPIVIRELARWVISGNSGAHAVKLVDAATDVDVPGGSVSIATAGAPVGFKYAALSAPVTLAANTSYYLVTQETSGGDQWYEANNTLTYPSTVATVNNAVYSSGATYAAGYSANNCYGPLSFRYSLPAQPFTVGHSMTTLRNDYTGWLGLKLTTGATTALVDQLGRWVVPGNTGTHTVKLVDATTGADLATASVATLGAPGGQFAYTPLAAPITLAANTSYYLLSQETNGGDQWYDFTQPAPGTATGYQQWLLANGLPMDASGQGSATASPANDGLPNLIKYALGLAPAVNGNAGRLSDGTTTDAGSDYLTFTYTRPEPAPSGITYAVQAGAELTPASWTTAGLIEVSSTVNAGLRTVTVRDHVPIAGGNDRFMRLEVTQP